MLINKYVYTYFRKPTTYCTETLNHLKLKILWLQIDLTNLDQLELEVSVSYNTRWILTVIEYYWIRSLKSFYLNLLIDDVLLLWVCHLAFSVCQTYKKHPIYIKISTYRCDLFNYLILNKSHMQCGYAWIGHAYSVYVTEYNYYKYKYNMNKYKYNIHLAHIMIIKTFY